MNYSTYRFTLDIHQTRSQVSIPVFYQDTWVKLLINLTDGGKPYTLEGVEKVILYGRKKDGTTLTEECDIIDNYTRIEYPFSEQTASAIGPVECEFRLYSKEGGKHITTPSFIILVEERVVEDEDLIPSVSNPSAIDRMIVSETAREEAETERLANEASRVSAEAERVKAETARVEAEAKRQNLADTIDAKIAGKVDKMEPHWGYIAAYTQRPNGVHFMYPILGTKGEFTIANREAGGVLRVGKAVGVDDAVPLAQMNEALTEKADTATVDTLAKKVANLEAGIADDMFTTDDTTAYIKSIPANAAPYAELRAVGGMIHAHQLPPPNLFKASVLDAENNRTYYDENYNVEPIIYANNGVYTIDQVNYTYGSVIYVTAATVRELFPDAVAGKKYDFSYDAEGESGTGIYFTGGGGYGICTMTEAILDGHLEMYGAETYDPDGGMYWPTSATYSNISLTEVGGGERYLTEAKVTALDIYGKNLYNGGFGGTACTTEENGVVTIVKRAGTGSQDRYTTAWLMPLKTEGWSISVTVNKNTTASGLWYGQEDTNGDTKHGILCQAGVTGRVSVKLQAPTEGANIYKVFLLLNYNEAEGTEVVLTDIMISPTTTATPTDTTYSPYHKHTFAIPEAVQALDGYGWGINDAVHNSIEWDEDGKPVYVKRVGRYVYDGTRRWWIGESQGKTYFSVGISDWNIVEDNEIVCNHYPYGFPYNRIPCAYTSSNGRDLVVFPSGVTTDEEWNALLAKWKADGDPLTVYYELKEPITTDISHLFAQDNLVPVEGGGVIIAVNETEEAAPSTIMYGKRGN